ncbi:ABC transporter ATP-binding protein [Enterococcus mundtii]|uniref:ATP-binding cassette domain-containing protein n=1 Tax=Enterococcus mundtii TaxID=53346 RepID=UPI0021B1161A|nr:ABC transporter ATP-binding protein [Enterococcus mundtii]
MQDENAQAQKDLILLLGNPEQFKMLPNFDFVKQLTFSTIKNMYSSLASTNKFAQITSYTVSFINQLSQNIIFITISYLVYNQQLQLNNMMVVSILMPIFFTSLSDLSKINVDYRTVVANQQFVQENLELHQEDLSGTPIGQITSIKFEDPQIKMTSNAKRIHLSLTETLNLGDICYIEGPSGSGKSTLIKSILGFYESNGLYINDLPIEQLDTRLVREQMTYLSQATLLFSNTLEYNITLGQTISDEKKEALKQSSLLAPIFKNKNWDSLIVDNGANLSGGEKQRVFIARMMLQDSKIWILDESTSSIDKDSADAIFNTLIKMHQNKIILFTSHDKENKAFANKIIQLSSHVETID